MAAVSEAGYALRSHAYDAEGEEVDERRAGGPPYWHDGPLLADLLASGCADHLVSLELSRCGLDDDGVSLLAHALVGHALFVQYLSLSHNPIGDEGVCALFGPTPP